MVSNFIYQYPYDLKFLFMKKVFLQYWEESLKNCSIRPDGCSLHITLNDRNSFVKKVYDSRQDKLTPNEYDMVVGDPIEVEVSDAIFEEITRNENSLRLMQHSLSNLKALEEVNILYDDEFDY